MEKPYFIIPKSLINKLMKEALINDNPIKGAGQLELLQKLLDSGDIILEE